MPLDRVAMRLHTHRVKHRGPAEVETIREEREGETVNKERVPGAKSARLSRAKRNSLRDDI